MSAEIKNNVAQPVVSLPRQMRDIALDLSQQTCNANAQFARGYCRALFNCAGESSTPTRDLRQRFLDIILLTQRNPI